MNYVNATAIGYGKWQVAEEVIDGPKSGGKSLQFAIRPEDMQHL